MHYYLNSDWGANYVRPVWVIAISRKPGIRKVTNHASADDITSADNESWAVLRETAVYFYYKRGCIDAMDIAHLGLRNVELCTLSVESYPKFV